MSALRELKSESICGGILLQGFVGRPVLAARLAAGLEALGPFRDRLPQPQGEYQRSYFRPPAVGIRKAAAVEPTGATKVGQDIGKRDFVNRSNFQRRQVAVRCSGGVARGRA